jgi:NADPH:quinone reductase-like Zn-dependent oxidoreductase
MKAASVWGRIVNIAYQEGAKVSLDLGPMLMKRLTLAATTLRSRSAAEKGVIRDALLGQVWPLVAKGRIRPVVDRRFPLAEAQKAHGYMEKPGATGKILLIP